MLNKKNIKKIIMSSELPACVVCAQRHDGQYNRCQSCYDNRVRKCQAGILCQNENGEHSELPKDNEDYQIYCKKCFKLLKKTEDFIVSRWKLDNMTNSLNQIQESIQIHNDSSKSNFVDSSKNKRPRNN